MVGSSPSAHDGVSGNSEELRSERQFRLLAESIPQIVWTTRPDGFCDYQNRRWFDYSGLTREDSAGLGWVEAVHPEDRARCHLDWANLNETANTVEFEYRLRRADGAFRWFLARAEPIRDDDGCVIRWFGTSTDIDDRKRAEDARFRASQERLRLAAAAARLGYWDWDILADRITWSESLAEIARDRPGGFRRDVHGFPRSDPSRRPRPR